LPEQDLAGLKIDKSKIAPQARKKRRLYYIIPLVAVIMLLIVLAFAGVFSPAVKVDAVTVSLVYPSQTFTLLNASGYVVPQRKAAVASKVTGRIIALYVEEGSRVKKDQILARLEADDVAAQRDQAQASLEVSKQNLEQAKAELADAKASFEREKSLLSQEFTTKAAFDTAEARSRKAIAAVSSAEASIRASSAALKAANVALDYTLIRAPFDAIVLTKNADIGDIVTPIGAAANAKAAVVTIADLGSLQVEADVSESNLKEIKAGQPTEIQLDAVPDTRFNGAIHMIVPTADRTKATVMVKVKFLTIDPRILPEMSAKVAFLSREVSGDEQKPRLAVSQKALKVRNGNATVFLVKGSRVDEVKVTTGPQLGDMVEINDGLKAGEKVVINPPNNLRDGSRIKLAQQ
jgi:RND family efflux transporter MFP subunit